MPNEDYIFSLILHITCKFASPYEELLALTDYMLTLRVYSDEFAPRLFCLVVTQFHYSWFTHVLITISCKAFEYVRSKIHGKALRGFINVFFIF